MDKTVAEAAIILGISERGVRSRIASGTLKARRSGPRLLLITEREIKRALAEGVPLGPRRKQAAEEKLKRQRRREGKADEPS